MILNLWREFSSCSLLEKVTYNYRLLLCRACIKSFAIENTDDKKCIDNLSSKQSRVLTTCRNVNVN